MDTWFESKETKGLQAISEHMLLQNCGARHPGRQCPLLRERTGNEGVSDRDGGRGRGYRPALVRGKAVEAVYSIKNIPPPGLKKNRTDYN